MSHWIEDYLKLGLWYPLRCFEIMDNSQGSEKERARVLLTLMLHGESTIFPHRHRRGHLIQELSVKPEPEQLADLPDFSKRLKCSDASGPNPAWLWAHDPKDATDWYETWKADLGEWCASLWSQDRLNHWGVIASPWTKDNYLRWAPTIPQQRVRERQARLAADPDKPRPLPCGHGQNRDVMPQRHGLLFYMGDTEHRNHYFSSCSHCLQELNTLKRVRRPSDDSEIWSQCHIEFIRQEPSSDFSRSPPMM